MKHLQSGEVCKKKYTVVEKRKNLVYLFSFTTQRMMTMIKEKKGGTVQELC